MLIKTTDLIDLAQKELSSIHLEHRNAAESLLSVAALHLKHEVLDLTPQQEKLYRVLNQVR